MKVWFFIVMISFLFIHEMDAIRAKEWKMFIMLKNMNENIAYCIFTLAHIPLYSVCILIMTLGGDLANILLYCVVDGFLILHALIHLAFKKHPNNGFISVFSKVFIFLPALLAIVHIFLVAFL